MAFLGEKINWFRVCRSALMLALRYGERALPLAWRVETTEGAIGFSTQKALLETVAPWLPAGAAVRLMGDRFYGTADLIGWCQDHGWGYLYRPAIIRGST